MGSASAHQNLSRNVVHVFHSHIPFLGDLHNVFKINGFIIFIESFLSYHESILEIGIKPSVRMLVLKDHLGVYLSRYGLYLAKTRHTPSLPFT